MERFFGYSRLLASGAPAPAATITVYDAGTLNLASIFSDNLSTPKANPFSADADGFLFFYAAGGRYDVKLSGGGIVAPYTWGDVVLDDFLSLNGQTGSAQTFATGTAGNDFAISSAANVHTFNLPSASATARGVVTTGAQTFAGLKTFTTPIGAVSGGTGIDASAAANGALLIGNGAGFTLATLTGTANQVTVSNGAGTITLATPQNIHTGASPTFTGLTLSGLTANAPFYAGVGGALTTLGAMTDGQLIIGVTGGAPVRATLTAGSNVTITNAAGVITINSSSPGITTLNALTGASQTFAVGTTGTDFNISSAGTTHTFNLPTATASARGVVTIDAQTFAGVKTFNSAPIFHGPATYKPGTASSVVATISGRIFSDSTQRANVGASSTLTSHSLQADTLDVDGKVLHIVAWGRFAANANAKRVYIQFGATIIADSTSSVSWNDYQWFLHAYVMRKSSTTQRAIGFVALAANGATAGNNMSQESKPGETLSGAVTIQTVGASGAAANNDVLQEGLFIEAIG